ncbi:hypothetical protein SprV_0602238100 [Sparganum proliferum]
MVEALLDSVRLLDSKTRSGGALIATSLLNIQDISVLQCCAIPDAPFVKNSDNLNCTVVFSSMSITFALRKANRKLNLGAANKQVTYEINNVPANAYVTSTHMFRGVTRVQVTDLTFPGLDLLIFQSMPMREYLSLPAWIIGAIADSVNVTSKAFAKEAPLSGDF